MSETPAGVLFDAYGTLFDVYAVEARLEALFPARGKALAQNWRVKQIDYSRLRTMSGRYAGFRSITADALDYACDAAGVTLSAEARAALMGAYERLPAHEDVPGALKALHQRGLKLGVLSNGEETMLRAALAAAGLEGLFAHVLSVERVRKFKTAPEAYQLGLEAFGAAAHEIVFVSSNGWDASGAAWFGYRAFWLNRSGAPRERLDAALSGEGRTMSDLAAFLGL